MKKIIYIVVELLLTGSVFAHIGRNNIGNGIIGKSGMMKGMMQHHEEMEEIMEEGTYNDLQELRKELGFNMAPWVKDEATFKQIQEMHEQMEKFMEEKGKMHMYGNRNGKMINCRMMN